MGITSEIVIGLGSGLIGTMVGSVVMVCLVSHKVGRWQGRIERWLEDHEERLQSGRDRVQDVPVLKEQVTRLSHLVDSVEDRERKMSDRYVSRRECEDRHKAS